MNKKPKKSKLYAVLRIIVMPLGLLIFRPKYIGRELVPDDGAFILASNHISATDPILLGLGLKNRQIKFMAKAELFKNKFLNWLFRKLGAFPVERGKSDRGAINHFEEALREGAMMGIFIEGTRSKTGDFLPPKNGVSLLSFQTKTPVIPVCITKIKSRRVIHFSAPLSLEDMGMTTGGAKEFRGASRVIMDNIKALREADLAEK